MIPIYVVLATVSKAINGNDYSHVYFQNWNVGWECGSDQIPGCRDAAVNYLTGTPQNYFSGQASIYITVGLQNHSGEDTEPIDLRQGKFVNGSWTQVDGVCKSGRGDAVSLTLAPSYSVLAKYGGCLTNTSAAATDARAFAVALVMPRKAVKNCPTGICLIGVNSPDSGVSAASDKVAKVCGNARKSCTFASGNWGAPVTKASYSKYTVSDRMSQLVGNPDVVYGNPTTNTCCNGHGEVGSIDHLVSNVPGVPGAMFEGEGYPLQITVGNHTGEHVAFISDLLIPCEHPGPFGTNDCA